MPCSVRMRRPVIELSDCIVCEVCSEACPDVFSLNDAGYIEIAEMTVYPEACIDEALRNCPGDCISWECAAPLSASSGMPVSE